MIDIFWNRVKLMNYNLSERGLAYLNASVNEYWYTQLQSYYNFGQTL
jgi:hypothetical protein